MKRRDVPGNVGRHAGEKRRQPPQLVFAVVEAGDQQRDDLEPDASAMQPRDRVQDRLQPSAELAVPAIVEALEIDFVEIDVRTKVLENALGAVAVGHEAGDQAPADAPP